MRWNSVFDFGFGGFGPVVSGFSTCRLYKMYKDLIRSKLFCDVLSFPNSCCISSEMSKILLLNSLVLQELIINLLLHSRSTKIIIIPTYIE